MLNLRPIAGRRQPAILVVLLTATSAVALEGCTTATTSAGADPGNAYLIVMAGFAIVFVVTVKATVLMAAALADLMAILRRIVAALAMFAGAAALTGAGMAIVAWVTLS